MENSLPKTDGFSDDNIDHKIISALESDIPEKDNLSSNLRSEKQNVNATTKQHPDIIQNVNNAVLLEYLSPEINNNESVKRQHKYIVLILVAIFLIFQFSAVYKMSMAIIDYAVSKAVNVEILKLLTGFVSAYITSVVVELIAILNYVAKKVFDTSIKELIELFKEENRLGINKEQEK